jgi:hypothetical protein
LTPALAKSNLMRPQSDSLRSGVGRLTLTLAKSYLMRTQQPSRGPFQIRPSQSKQHPRPTTDLEDLYTHCDTASPGMSDLWRRRSFYRPPRLRSMDVLSKARWMLQHRFHYRLGAETFAQQTGKYQSPSQQKVGACEQ